MKNYLTNHFILLLISCLWVFNISSSYADIEPTYYTFVMHKPKGQDWHRLSDSASKLAIGSYRFQIVYTQQPELRPIKWLALRGEFEFVKDEQSGEIKVKSRQTLDEKHYVDKNPRLVFSLWSAKKTL